MDSLDMSVLCFVSNISKQLFGNNEESLMLDFRDHAEYGNSVTMIVIWSLFFYPRGRKKIL